MPVDLLEICNAALGDGATFPAIWKTILLHSPLVKGSPVQQAAGRLEVKLINGQRLIYELDEKRFQLA